LTFDILFRCNPIKEQSDKREDDIGNPYSDKGGQITKGCKDCENLHEKDVDKGEGQSETQVKSNASANFSA
jgi:hypothetical protein